MVCVVLQRFRVLAGTKKYTKPLQITVTVPNILQEIKKCPILQTRVILAIRRLVHTYGFKELRNMELQETWKGEEESRA